MDAQMGKLQDEIKAILEKKIEQEPKPQTIGPGGDNT